MCGLPPMLSVESRGQPRALRASVLTCVRRIGMQPAALAAGLVDYLVEAGTSAEERGLALARDIAQARPIKTYSRT